MTEEQRQEIIRRLQQGEELSPEWARILFPPEKREYELVYHGKEREEDILANTLAVPLQKVRTFGKNSDDWHNMLIFGDNLQVMKSLLEMKRAGKLCNADGTPGVRLVYIDPPFASKQDFQGTQDQRAYQDRVAGAQFIEFLRKRVILLRELLAENGTVYVHLDWRKCHYIKTLLDEVFGEQNFQNEIVWERTNAHNMPTKSFVRAQDTIFFYSRSERFVFNKQYERYGEAQLRRFKRDKDGRLYTGRDLTFSTVNKARQFEWRGAKPPSNRSWGFDYEELERLWAAGKILKKKDGTPRLDGLVAYLDELPGKPVTTIWDDLSRVGNTAGERLDYPTQKPEGLIERIIRACSIECDLVLDAFAGSGTTCAVAEKLGRRWIGIDCGKLAIYTIEKRMLNLRRDIGNKGPALKPKPFTLYNAGLYDFSKLKELPWDAWRFFALQLFQCRDEAHKIGGIQLDGFLKGASVLVYNHQKKAGVRIDEETIHSLHEALGTKIGSRMFIIAPALVFDFQQDYLALEGVRYYALRIPYSIIHELHQREFTALKQPADELAVNETVDAVGFDFIRRPELEFDVSVEKRKGELLDEAVIRIKTFKSDAVVREPLKKKGNRETLSMVMLDYDFDSESDVFDLDAVFYADGIENEGWAVRFPLESVGNQVMAEFVDIYGNEARELIPASEFGVGQTKAPTQRSRNPQTKRKK